MPSKTDRVIGKEGKKGLRIDGSNRIGGDSDSAFTLFL